SVEVGACIQNYKEMIDNKNKNLQKDISVRIKYESIKEQDRKISKARSKTIKISKENPYINNSLASIVLKEKIQELESDEYTILLLTGTLVVFGLVDELVGSSSRAPEFETLGQWLNNEAFDIFAVTETNLDRKEEFFVGKK
ncbi:500_t:CDS:2, partial [Gigaspora margarita]